MDKMKQKKVKKHCGRKVVMRRGELQREWEKEEMRKVKPAGRGGDVGRAG